MYQRKENQELIDQLQQVNDNLQNLQALLKTQSPKAPPESDVENLTRVQYELSNELFAGLNTLREVIRQGEKYTGQAKARYEK